MSARWRIIQRPIKADVKNAEKYYVLACIALHNYLRQTNNSVYTPAGFADSECSSGKIRFGEWRANISEGANLSSAVQNVRPIRGSRQKDECIQMRDDLRDYFSTDEGSVSWQWDYIRRTYKN